MGVSYKELIRNDESADVPVQSRNEKLVDTTRRDQCASEQKTTLILRNIPTAYTREMLLTTLDAEGFACLYDFVYLPIKIKRNVAFGYAFINLIDEEAAERFRKHF